MIKTKLFSENFDELSLDKQINKWISKHPDYIIVDVKFDSVVVNISVNFSETEVITCSALVIYREYENV